MTDSGLLSVLSSDVVQTAALAADHLEALFVFGEESRLEDPNSVEFSASSAEIAAAQLFATSDPRATEAAKAAFEIIRGLIRNPRTADDRSEGATLRLTLRAACLGVLGDVPSQARQLLGEVSADSTPGGSNWAATVETTALTVWLLLIRKGGWSDLDDVTRLTTDLREAQPSREPAFLESTTDQGAAWRLVTSYHLLRTAEIVNEYTATGSIEGNYDPVEQAQMHFDRAREGAELAGDAELSFISTLLEHVAQRLIAGSVWSAARGMGSRAQRFVENLASRARPRPMLDLLPPQRHALLESGLIGTGRRSVVVSLPTSAGKTLVAEFRILQALDRYEEQAGWIAYTAPTRALVNQLTSRLRRDFEPLGIRVEKFSPALEVDSVEAELLDDDDQNPFRIVVTTPEKLDLLLRGGWTEEIQRPLSLVIVDEAHNLGIGSRGLKLELLLATINREHRDSSFMLLTPFVPNADAIASWLDPANSEAVQLAFEWMPNDRVVGLVTRQKGQSRGDSVVLARTVVASKPSLQSPRPIVLTAGRPLGTTFSKLDSPGLLAAAASDVLGKRGSTVTLVQQPRHSWSLAAALAASHGTSTSDPDVGAVQSVIRAEYGDDYPLVELLSHRTAVHHAGLSDDVRSMVEALAERGALDHLVATTTLAQGINFPVMNVVLASHQYPYGEDMPPADFWNIAGRAGRADHGQAGIVLLSAPEEQRERRLTEYLMRSSGELVSTLVTMVKEALEREGTIDLSRLSVYGDWSAFDQFITHTLRVAGAERFNAQVEQVLRGTLGFRTLRAESPNVADQLVRSVQQYAATLAGRPISLVDSTGFSWESVSAAIARMNDAGIGHEPWGSEIFDPSSRTLKDAIGVLLRVPELREQLVENLDSGESDGDFLARVVKDWVGGRSLAEIASEYFSTSESGKQRDTADALTRCCQRLFSSILPAVSWGLSALQALNLRGHDAEVAPELRDVPSYVFYGVASREAVALRLFGVPRGAAGPLARHLADDGASTTNQLRSRLSQSTEGEWTAALGQTGESYYRAWRLVESAA